MHIREVYPDVITEDLDYEYKAVLNPENPVKWAKTIVGYANSKGGIMFVGVSNDGEAFGLGLDEIDKTKNLIATVNDRHIFPHARVQYMMRSVDPEAEHYVLAVKVVPADSILRYREGDFNETVYVKGDGNTPPASPEEIIALHKRKHGVDNETSEVKYDEKKWTEYLNLCREYRKDASIPTMKDLQNEEIVSGDGYVKSGLIMFSDDYDGDDTLICCRLWDGTRKIGSVLDQNRMKGSLAKTFQNVIRFIDRNTKTGWIKTRTGGREEIRAYPREAIREALVNAIAHRDYSIAGTQIDVDIFRDRIEIVSPGSWLLPRSYEDYPLGTIPSIRRNSIIAACLDAANLMERSGTGFQTMFESYKDSEDYLQPVVTVYPGFLNLRLYDRLYDASISDYSLKDDKEKILYVLKEEGPSSVRELQTYTKYGSRSQFLSEVVNPLLASGIITRDGNPKSPRAKLLLSAEYTGETGR